jgi:glutamine amidotransferase-like uncharacterized protein
MGISIWQVVVFLGGSFILFVPCLAALASRRVKGWDKALWAFLSLCLSWVGYFGYYLLMVRKSADTVDGLIRPKRV